MSDNPHDEAPAAWALWRFVIARIPESDTAEFAALMRDYRDEVASEQPAVRDLTLQQAFDLQRVAGKVIDRDQRARWEARGWCGICGFDGDRSNCRDCNGGNVSASR